MDFTSPCLRSSSLSAPQPSRTEPSHADQNVIPVGEAFQDQVRERSQVETVRTCFASAHSGAHGWLGARGCRFRFSCVSCAADLYAVFWLHCERRSRYKQCNRNGWPSGTPGCSKSWFALRMPMRSMTARDLRLPTAVNETISVRPRVSNPMRSALRRRPPRWQGLAPNTGEPGASQRLNTGRKREPPARHGEPDETDELPGLDQLGCPVAPAAGSELGLPGVDAGITGGRALWRGRGRTP